MRKIKSANRIPQRKIFYDFGTLNDEAFLEKEFEWAQKRSVKERVAHGFLKTYKPVMDDEPYRIFDRLSDYKAWCEKALPSWLGYGRTAKDLFESRP